MIIAGKYRVVRVLGEGGMGIVYLAEQAELGRSVAVKVLRREALTDPDTVERFRREARVVARLNSPHVARIIDFGTTDEGFPFMVLEHLDGNDLDDEIERRGALPLGEAVEYVLEACEGVREAHAAGVVHRDLKPGNLFLANEGGRRVVKVLDFGISKVTADEQVRVTQTSSAFGTPLYMSPEHVRSTKSVDHRTDIWSLGVILYELATGTPPFNADSPTAVAVAVATDPLLPASLQRPGLPEELDAVLARALAKNPADRYPTVAAFADALRPLVVLGREGPELAPRARTASEEHGAMATTHMAPRQAKRRAMWIGLAGATVVAGLIGAVLYRGGGSDVAAPPRATAAAGQASALAVPSARAVDIDVHPVPSSSAEGVADAPSASAPAAPSSAEKRGGAPRPRSTGATSSPTGAPAQPQPQPGQKDGSGRPIVL